MLKVEEWSEWWAGIRQLRRNSYVAARHHPSVRSQRYPCHRKIISRPLCAHAWRLWGEASDAGLWAPYPKRLQPPPWEIFQPPILLTLLLLWPLVGRGLTILHLIGLKDALFCE